MKSNYFNMSIWVIDKVRHWRRFTSETLRGEGFPVRVFENYEAALEALSPPNVPPDLAILGCMSFSDEEAALVKVLTAHSLPLLVFTSQFAFDELRFFFRKGALDVAPRTFETEKLIALVTETLESISSPQYTSCWD